tara:strand:+ start:71 stop:256 length:186 start_codon:yes stop_codon:yes gene_type:complete
MPPKKVVNVKPIKNVRTYDKPQIDIKKDLDDDKKIKPEKIFDGYKKPAAKAKKTKKKAKRY